MSFAIKQNDTSPAFSSTLEAPAGTPVDLTGATVQFKMTNRTTAAVKVDAVEATIVDAAAGKVSYSWAVGDTDTPGFYNAEWIVTFANGQRRTFPAADYLVVHVWAAL